MRQEDLSLEVDTLNACAGSITNGNDLMPDLPVEKGKLLKIH